MRGPGEVLLGGDEPGIKENDAYGESENSLSTLLGVPRTALKRLDVRVPNLVAQYKKARIIVDAGHRLKTRPGEL